MATASRRERKLADMTVRELAQLRLLNDKLTEAEHWVHRRAARCLFDYHRSGGLKAAKLDERTFEDVEVEAIVSCILSETHPDFRPDEDNVVATLNAGVLLIENNELDKENWNEVPEREPHPLSDMHFCWLFHDLFDHRLGGDWNRMLQIDGLEIEVTLKQQRGMYWAR